MVSRFHTPVCARRALSFRSQFKALTSILEEVVLSSLLTEPHDRIRVFKLQSLRHQIFPLPSVVRRPLATNQPNDRSSPRMGQGIFGGSRRRDDRPPLLSKMGESCDYTLSRWTAFLGLLHSGICSPPTSPIAASAPTLSLSAVRLEDLLVRFCHDWERARGLRNDSEIRP